MRRRQIILAGLAALPTAARAQGVGRVRRVGFLRAAPPPDHELSAFILALAKRGYIEGRDFVLVRQWGDGDIAKFSELAVSLVNSGVDIIVTEGTVAVRTTSALTNTIPIVTTSAADPYMGGLIKDLARPGGNVTGFASLEREISSKVFEILMEFVPGLTLIAVLGARSIWPVFAEVQDRAATALGVKYRFVDMPRAEDVDQAMGQAVAIGAQGVVMRGSPYFSSMQRRKIIESAAEHRLPTIYERRDDAERGGLVSYAPNVELQYGATADYVVRILEGAAPGGLPIQQPTKFELIINVKSAKALGLTVPPSLLARADEVID